MPNDKKKVTDNKPLIKDKMTKNEIWNVMKHVNPDFYMSEDGWGRHLQASAGVFDSVMIEWENVSSEMGVPVTKPRAKHSKQTYTEDFVIWFLENEGRWIAKSTYEKVDEDEIQRVLRNIESWIFNHQYDKRLVELDMVDLIAEKSTQLPYNEMRAEMDALQEDVKRLIIENQQLNTRLLKIEDPTQEGNTER